MKRRVPRYVDRKVDSFDEEGRTTSEVLRVEYEYIECTDEEYRFAYEVLGLHPPERQP